MTDHWKMTPLIKVATLQRGFDLPKKERVKGDIPIIAANGPIDTHNTPKVKGPGVITGRSGTLGKVHFQESDYWPLNTSLWVKDFHGNDPKWVSYLLKSMKLERFTRGAGVPTLNRNLIHGELIPLPPIEEQKRIACILDKADELRKQRKKSICLCDMFLKALFIDMFGDPINNQMCWEVKKMGELSSKIHSGTTPKGGSKVYVDKGITFFRSQNVWKNRLVYDDIAFIDSETHSKMKKSSLKHKDILMTKTGRVNTENSSLGRAAMFLGEDDSANVNGHVYLIRLHENVLHEFVLFILTSDEYRQYIRSVCVGGIDKRQLNKNHLEEFPIIQPPLELQKKFTDIVKEVNRNRALMQQSLDKLNDNFEALSQRAFKGEL